MVYDNPIGKIPKEIGGLTNFERLSMCCNKFSGSVPREIGNLTAMYGIFLHNNALSGIIPTSSLPLFYGVENITMYVSRKMSGTRYYAN